jgi:hypothetical protein
VGDLEHRHVDVTDDEYLSKLSQIILWRIVSLRVDLDQMRELRAQP